MKTFKRKRVIEIDDLDVILRERRLPWFGHVELSSSAIKTVCDMQVEGKRGPRRPKMSWRTLTESVVSETQQGLPL